MGQMTGEKRTIRTRTGPISFRAQVFGFLWVSRFGITMPKLTIATSATRKTRKYEMTRAPGNPLFSRAAEKLPVTCPARKAPVMNPMRMEAI